MARFTSFALVFLVLSSSTFLSVSEGRKLLAMKEHENKRPYLDGSLFLSVLPKGNVPSSTPSRKGHAEVVDEKLIARHLIAIDRSLRSVPSPGVGN
ncbi:hypothetical protein UlMin_018676 [Ulmus minor]